jgi:hypothetical protein
VQPSPVRGSVAVRQALNAGFIHCKQCLLVSTSSWERVVVSCPQLARALLCMCRQAIELCPQLVVVPYLFEQYATVSEKVSVVYRH